MTDNNLIQFRKKTLLIALAFFMIIGGIIGLIISFGGNNGNNNSDEVNLIESSSFMLYAKEAGLDMNKFSVCLNSGGKALVVDSDYELGQRLKVSGTPTFVLNAEMVEIGAAPYDSFKKLFDAKLAEWKSFDEATLSQLKKDRDITVKMIIGETGETLILGHPDATLVFVEFSDFQCPYCRSFWKDTLPQIKRDYIVTGKMVFVYKNFPLSSTHPYAQKAAEAGLCANDQGKFWEYHDILFKKQAEWS